ncbi:nucleoside 2-deoxyribosyltransferase [Vibrio chagasii]|uniref:nucleoside 2-deoxyribosyltransferase n=1 Tax=Vibrio chagasii TaxID=170679 RepID=UPI001EFC3CB0|nr:nucleoside 2-deoxyribosyltransferase [Vibrio chagasii]MCG9563531.1 nucleoside 2-deoxyribosyltransferase [Vibrio chagasii]
MESKKAFILMPFTESLNDVYEFLIKGALVEAGYQVKRADDIKSQSNILEDIVKGIIESDLIVADLTDSNANVYYELGIAHALQKKVVLITQEIDELPFDLKSYRVIGYSTHFSRMNEAKNELHLIAEEASNGSLPFGNPVKDYGKTQNVSESVFPVVVHENNDESDLGFLDHIVQVEENFEDLSEIVGVVGSKLVDELTPEINRTTKMLTTSNLTTKQRRNIIKDLAKHVDDYANLLKSKNDEYRELNKKVETSIEIVLTLNQEHNEESIEGIESFLTGFESLENGAQGGRDGFIDLLTSMENMPNLEKSFNRASKEVQRELQLFINNIDQTISMASRARTLGRSLLAKALDKVPQ